MNGAFIAAPGGNGTTFAEVASELIAADIAGKPDPDAELFAAP